MTRNEIINQIGYNYMTHNIENDEFSYSYEARSRENLKNKLGRDFKHEKLDIRFKYNDIVILVETKQKFKKKDEEQLKEYLEEEIAVFNSKKIICILANTNDDKIKVWKNEIDEDHLLKDETIIDTAQHYEKLFKPQIKNNREMVMKNTYSLNELLHKKDIDEAKRSQFVGTCLLYVKEKIKNNGYDINNKDSINSLYNFWNNCDKEGNAIRTEIGTTLNNLLDGSDNKEDKIKLLQKNIIEDQKVKKLKNIDLKEILQYIIENIYKYINTNSSEGQDILNLFFITFNKYTGKADKNQAFTPDHITDFMAKLTEVNRDSIVLDPCCGSGSFLVQAMVKALSDCSRETTEIEEKTKKEKVKKEHIFGIELEEKAFGLSTTNMLIHGDGNSNIIRASCFDKEDFIKKANPDIILMNPPYNSKPINIPNEYQKNWKSKEDKKEDPTKGLVFVKYLSKIVKEMNKERNTNNISPKSVKLAVLLPVQCAIASSNILKEMKIDLLKDNTLEAVFTLPSEVFYPGASVNACCMYFILGVPHPTDKEVFFGYYKEDGFKKKKNLGRVEQLDQNGDSLWKEIEKKWLKSFNNKDVIDGLSARHIVTGEDEWLCEAYMKTDYSTLTQEDFQNTLNNYLSYLVKEGKVYES